MHAIVTSSRCCATKMRPGAHRRPKPRRRKLAPFLNLDAAQDRGGNGKQHRIGKQRDRCTDQLDQYTGGPGTRDFGR